MKNLIICFAVLGLFYVTGCVTPVTTPRQQDILSKLKSYKIGETTRTTLFSDAGVPDSDDSKNGFFTGRVEGGQSATFANGGVNNNGRISTTKGWTCWNEKIQMHKAMFGVAAFLECEYTIGDSDSVLAILKFDKDILTSIKFQFVP